MISTYLKGLFESGGGCSFLWIISIAKPLHNLAYRELSRHA